MPNSDLKKFTTESFIKEIKEGRKDFSDTDLTEVDFIMTRKSIDRDNFLSSLNMSGAKLESTALCEMNLTGINLSNANLTGVNFNFSNLDKADLSSANLYGASLNCASLIETNLKGANLGFVDMGTILLSLSIYSSKTNFAKSNLASGKFIRNFLYKINMNEIYAWELEFDECKLIKCNFSGGDFYLAKFLNCEMSDLDFSGEVNYINAKFKSCNMKKINFSGNCLSLVNFEDVKSDNLDFTGAVLCRAEFTNSSLTNANFTNANLRGALFKNCDLTGAKFTGIIQATCSEDKYKNIIDDYFNMCKFEEGEEFFKSCINDMALCPKF
jgi:2-iminobutanoate/2-iminopropanoate deaminase